MSNEYVVKRNEPSALPRFAALNAAWIRDMHFLEPSDKKMISNPEVYIAGRNSVFSLHRGDVVTGVCALKEDCDGAFELTKMAVDPAYQGRGLGQVLMDAAHEHARNVMELSRIYLLSNTDNAAALRLYTRNGWAVNHEGAHPVYSRCNIGMEKIL